MLFFPYHWQYFQAVGKALFWAHVEGRLKVNIFMLSLTTMKFQYFTLFIPITYKNDAE